MLRRHTRKAFLLLVFAGVATAGASSNKGKIAFAVAHPWGLHVLDLQTREVEKLNVDGDEIGNIDYNRKRNLLVFESWPHEDLHSIYIHELSTKQTHLLYEPGSLDESRYRPTFHPEGEYVFVVSQAGKVFRHNIKTKGWTAVEVANTDCSEFSRISFSDTGRKVALIPRGARREGLLIGDIVGSTISIKNHVLGEFELVFSARWISEKELVFHGARLADGAPYLWRASLTDGSLKQLTHENFVILGAIALSRDKRWIAFGAEGKDRPPGFVIWKVSVDGEGLERLTSGEYLHGQSSPVWIE